MRKLLALLPEATVCVAEDDRPDYAEAVPAGQLMTHPNVPGLARIRNWLNEHIQEDCLVMVDDDLRGIRPTIGKTRLLTDPEIIAQVIRNAHQTCVDLDINVFCWSRCLNPGMVHPDMVPIRLVGPMSSGFGLRGAARQRRFDPECDPREDLDFSLETLLKDRILYSDMRWYLDFGRDFAGRGGNVGLVDDEKKRIADQTLRKRWGKYMGTQTTRFGSKLSSDPMSVQVSRQSSLSHPSYWLPK